VVEQVTASMWSPPPEGEQVDVATRSNRPESKAGGEDGRRVRLRVAVVVSAQVRDVDR